MNLLNQSGWWLVPFVLMILVMLHAMMEFTVSLLVQQPQGNRMPIRVNELDQRLLAESKESQSYQLVKGEDCDLEITWETAEPANTGRRAYGGSGGRSHIRLLFDEARHDLRMNQVSRSYYYFFGMVGWLPRIRGYASAQSGPPEARMTGEISRIANRYGWNVRPVLWWFQATHRGFRILEKLTPAPLQRWPARRFWGMLYPLSFTLAITYLILIAGGLNWDNFVLVAGVSAAWWGTWGVLVWALLGFPAFWRGRRK